MAFTIQVGYEEMKTHLLDRSRFHAAKAEGLAEALHDIDSKSFEQVQKITETLRDVRSRPSRYFGIGDGGDLDQRRRIVAEVGKLEVERLQGQARMFEFYASHMPSPSGAGFTLTLFEAASLEFVKGFPIPDDFEAGLFPIRSAVG